jgi:NADH-quinone oxidoreductase subunit N
MTLFMLSLAGIPPLAGFWAKLYIFAAAVQEDLIWLAILGVVNSVVSAYYYMRVVVAMYMREGQIPEEPAKRRVDLVCPALQVGVGLASVVIVVLGIVPGPILNLARASILALLGG